ncbi:MAG: peptidase E [Chloroflexi bacterium]|nr:peptidase E [Chloroflexota bacterium]
MGKIVGVGGGHMDALETLAIDKSIVELTGKDNPSAILLPTATYDSPERWEVFNRVYRDRLGCRTEVLYLLQREPSEAELRERILSKDIIYVSGGNTLKMMNRWRKLGVDNVLREAYEKGVLLAGQSAGMICWFSYGHSDSLSYYHAEDWKYIRVKGMGLIDAIGCPHYDGGTNGVRRADDYHAMMLKHLEPGIGVDNHCAVQLVDGTYRVVTARPGAGAYGVQRQGKTVVVERLEQRKDFAPAGGLFVRR